MTREIAIIVLDKHNHWRRCNDDDCDCDLGSTKELGVALEFEINYLKK